MDDVEFWPMPIRPATEAESEAIAEILRSADAPDANIAVTLRIRKLVGEG